MKRNLKVIETYQCRDGVTFAKHEDAVRHEYEKAIPAHLAGALQTILDAYFITLTAQQLEDVASAILTNNYNNKLFIELLSDYNELAPVIRGLDWVIEQNLETNHE